MWRALAATERAQFEQRAAKLQAEYEVVVKEFRASGGTLNFKKRRIVKVDAGGKKRNVNRGTADPKVHGFKKPRNNNRPIKPCAGGHGVFLKNSRAITNGSHLDGDSKQAYTNQYDNLLKEYREQQMSTQAAKLRLPVQRADGVSGMLALLLGTNTALGWFWRLTNGTRHASSRCRTPLLALQDWLSKHGTTLSSASLEDLEAWRLRQDDASFPTTTLASSPKQNPPTQQPPKKRARRRVRNPRVQEANASASIQSPQANANPSIPNPPSKPDMADALLFFESWCERISVLRRLWLQASTDASVNAEETGLLNISSQRAN